MTAKDVSSVTQWTRTHLEVAFAYLTSWSLWVRVPNCLSMHISNKTVNQFKIFLKFPLMGLHLKILSWALFSPVGHGWVTCYIILAFLCPSNSYVLGIHWLNHLRYDRLWKCLFHHWQVEFLPPRSKSISAVRRFQCYSILTLARLTFLRLPLTTSNFTTHIDYLI